MSAENKAVVRRLFQEVWNRGNLDVAEELFAPDYVNHSRQPAGFPPGVRALKQLVSSVRGTFPDFQMTLEDLIAEEDKVVARWKAAGNMATLTEIGIFRIDDGKIVESWVTSDQSVSSFLPDQTSEQLRNLPAEKVAVNY